MPGLKRYHPDDHDAFPAGPVIEAIARVFATGESYDGPRLRWSASPLAATAPEPHIALRREYLEDNDLDLDLERILTVAFQAGFENGWRNAAQHVNETLLT